MNGRERVLNALQRKASDLVPVFEWFIDGAVSQALTGTTDPLEVVEQLDLDAINIRADYEKKNLDDVTLVDEWGIKRQLTGDVLPALLESPIADICDHQGYQFPDPEKPGRFATLERALQKFGDQRSVVLNLRDGFSDMRDLLGYQEALIALLIEPERFKELLDRAVTYNLRLAAIARERYGIEVVATTDDVANATGLLMRPETYFEMIGPQFRRVIQGYKDLGLFCIKHCDGNVDAVLDFWVECGIDCLDPIDPAGGYTMGAMKAKYGHQICLKGNIDCTAALCDGTEDEVVEEVRQCIEAGASGGGLILSSSNTIHRGVRPENFKAMLRAAREYGRLGAPA